MRIRHTSLKRTLLWRQTTDKKRDHQPIVMTQLMVKSIKFLIIQNWTLLTSNFNLENLNLPKTQNVHLNVLKVKILFENSWPKYFCHSLNCYRNFSILETALQPKVPCLVKFVWINRIYLYFPVVTEKSTNPQCQINLVHAEAWGLPRHG